MSPFLAALDEDLGLPFGLGDEERQVVARAELPVGSRNPDGDGHPERGRRLRLGEAEPGRETDLRGQVPDHQGVALGRVVLRHHDDRKELVQQADVGREEDDPGQGQWRADVTAVDAEAALVETSVGLRGLQGQGEGLEPRGLKPGAGSAAEAAERQRGLEDLDRRTASGRASREQQHRQVVVEDPAGDRESEGEVEGPHPLVVGDHAVAAELIQGEGPRGDPGHQHLGHEDARRPGLAVGQQLVAFDQADVVELVLALEVQPGDAEGLAGRGLEGQDPVDLRPGEVGKDPEVGGQGAARDVVALKARLDDGRRVEGDGLGLRLDGQAGPGDQQPGVAQVGGRRRVHGPAGPNRAGEGHQGREERVSTRESTERRHHAWPRSGGLAELGQAFAADPRDARCPCQHPRTLFIFSALTAHLSIAPWRLETQEQPCIAMPACKEARVANPSPPGRMRGPAEPGIDNCYLVE